ncbi:MAG: efflux RND transporter periplasmic adaptor subunit [Alphaproteobacteria bacterium]|nr:efflux RND transporter periplasmic adaptor subunit [Alphaproteobacteria bacterium]
MEETKRQNFFIRLFLWLWHNKWWVFGAIIIIILILWWAGVFSSSKKHKYITADITRGDIVQTVTASGEIQPVNTINVGSQVSGTIEDIFVDYNSVVKKGDVLLKIEPSVLQSTVDESLALLESAKAELKYAQSEFERNQSLYNDGFISRAEMEKSQTLYEQAQQAVNKAQYTFERAETNLGYATITSPVDGTVISRKVDKGQTVAASFQTPDLFEIAEDLSKMQIETAVSEADIGMVKEGLPVTFTVDAYPNMTFKGNVQQIRLSPTNVSNVVVYTVVIDVDNSDLKLMPGMTAFVTVVVAEAKDIWKTKNSALLMRSFQNVIKDRPLDEKMTPKTHLAIKRDKDIVFVPYTKGLTTPTETQIISDDIKEKDKIIVGIEGQTTTNKSSMGPRM